MTSVENIPEEPYLVQVLHFQLGKGAVAASPVKCSASQNLSSLIY